MCAQTSAIVLVVYARACLFVFVFFFKLPSCTHRAAESEKLVGVRQQVKAVSWNKFEIICLDTVAYSCIVWVATMA